MATTYYWVGTGTWNGTNTANWAIVSGGSSGHGPPGSTDTAIFDNNSGGNCTVGANISVASLIMTGYAHTFTGGNYSYSLTITGATCTLVSSGQIELNEILFSYTGTTTFTPPSSALNVNYIEITAAGTLILGGNLNAGNTDMLVTANGASFNSNGYAVSVGEFHDSEPSGTITLGSSTVTLGNSNGTVWLVGAATVSAASATIVVLGGFGTTATFTGGGNDYGTLEIAPNGGTVAISDADTFGTLTCSTSPASGDTLTLPAGETTTVTGTLNLNGASGAVLTVNSSSPGTQATLSAGSGVTVNASYLSLQDNAATGGATFTATNSSAVSNVTGWSGFGVVLVAYAQIKLIGSAAQSGILPLLANAETALRGKGAPSGLAPLATQTIAAVRSSGLGAFALAAAAKVRAVLTAGLIPPSGQVAQMFAAAVITLRGIGAPSGAVRSLAGKTLARTAAFAPLFDYASTIALAGAALVTSAARFGSIASTALGATARATVKAYTARSTRVPLSAKAAASFAGRSATIVRLALRGTSSSTGAVSVGIPGLTLALSAITQLAAYASANKIQTLLIKAMALLASFAKATPGGKGALAGKGILTLTAPARPGPSVSLAGAVRSAARVFVGYSAVANLAAIPLIAVKAKTAASVPLTLAARTIASVLARVGPQGIIALASDATIALRGRGGPSGAVPVTGAAKIKLAADAAPTGAVAILGTGLAAIRASAANALVPLALHAASAIAVRVRAGSNAATSLAGRSIVSLSAAGGSTFNLALAAASRAALAASVPVITPLALAAKAIAAIKVRPGSQVVLTLAATALAAAKARTAATATVGLGAVSSIAAKLQSAPRGIVAIAGAARAAASAPGSGAVLYAFLNGATFIAGRAKAAPTTIANLVTTSLIALQVTTINKTFTLGRVLQNVKGRLRSLRNLTMRD